MNVSKKKYGRLFTYSLIIASILLQVGAGLFTPTSVAASGEVFTWVSSTKLKLSGGVFQPYNPTLSVTVNGYGAQTTVSSAGNNLSLQYSPGNYCVAKVSFYLPNLSNSSRGTIKIEKGDTLDSTEKICQVNSGGTNTLISGYSSSGTSVSIGNSSGITFKERTQTGTETSDQSSITLVTYPQSRWNDPSTFPRQDSVQITKKGSGGAADTIIGTVTLPKINTKGITKCDSYSCPETIYTTKVGPYAPGDYRFCSVIDKACYDYTKVKYQPLTANIATENSFISVAVRQYKDKTSGNEATRTFFLSRFDNAGVTLVRIVGTAEGAAVDGIQKYTANFVSVGHGKYSLCFGQGTDAICRGVEKVTGNNLVINLNDGSSDLNSGAGPAAKNDKGSDATCKVDGALGWILTPVCTAATAATQKLGEVVTDSLKISPITQSGTSGSVYTAWKSFRDLSNAFLVLIFLIAIFYQVLPIEVDAYTVKKVLPRLIAAAIAIQASFFMCQVAIDISNVLGGGIDTIFQGINSGAASGGQAVGVLNGGITAIVGIGIGIAFIGPVFFLLIAAVISILTMLISIQAREVIIILLVLGSPVAILASILPNTEDYFKKWWQNFLKLLLMYPLIQILLSGSVMVSRILNVSGLGQIQQVMISFIPVIAFFMVPAMFKMSGSLMGAVGGAINNKGFGVSKKIAGRAKEDAKAINAERGATLLSSDKFGKRTLGRVLSGNALSFGDRGQRKIRAAINKNYAEIAETAQDKYNSMGNAERFKHFNELKKSKKAKDQLEATALGNMIAANSGGPEMGKLFDELEGYEFNADGSYKKDSAGNLINNAKIVDNGDGTFTRGKVTRDANGSVVKVADNTWNEIAKRNSSFLATAVPHSVSKPASQAGASALIAAKGSGFAEQLVSQARDLQALQASSDPRDRARGAEGLQKLANQFVAAAQREDASDMQGSTVAAFQKLASEGLFNSVALNFKGEVGGSTPTSVADFISRTTVGGSLARTVQG